MLSAVSPKDRSQKLLLRRNIPIFVTRRHRARRSLPDEYLADFTKVPTGTIPSSPSSFFRHAATSGTLSVICSGPSGVSTASTLKRFQYPRPKLALSYELAGEDYRVLIVVSAPTHIGDKDALPQRKLPLAASMPVRYRLPHYHHLELPDQRPLRDPCERI